MTARGRYAVSKVHGEEAVFLIFLPAS